MLSSFSDDAVDALLKPNMLNEDALLQQINVLLTPAKKENKSTDK